MLVRDVTRTRKDGRLRPVAKSKLLKDAGHVVLDGAFRQLELPGNRLVAQALTQKLDDLLLARGQSRPRRGIPVGGGIGVLMLGAEELGRQGRRDIALAGMDPSQRAYKLRPLDAL